MLNSWLTSDPERIPRMILWVFWVVVFLSLGVGARILGVAVDEAREAARRSQCLPSLPQPGLRHRTSVRPRTEPGDEIEPAKNEAQELDRPFGYTGENDLRMCGMIDLEY